MAVKLANNATSTLAAPITSSDTVVTVQAGDAATFPALGAGEWFPLAVVDSSLNREIMKVTAVSGASLTVTRAQEGTVALAFAAGSKCELRATAIVFSSLTTDIAGKAALVHTHAEGDVTGLTSALAGKEVKGTYASKSGNYTALLGDRNAILRFSAGATLSLTAAATLGAGWHAVVIADGGAVTIDPNGSETINGAASISLPNGYSTSIVCDGTGFLAAKDYGTIVAALAGKLAKDGDTMSGNLRILKTTPVLTLEQAGLVAWTVQAGIDTRLRILIAGASTEQFYIDANGDIGTSLLGSLATALAAKLSTSALMSTIAGQGLAAQGTPIFARNTAGATAPGALVAGTNLVYASSANQGAAVNTGTWRCCGTTGGASEATLWVRT